MKSYNTIRNWLLLHFIIYKRVLNARSQNWIFRCEIEGFCFFVAKKSNTRIENANYSLAMPFHDMGQKYVKHTIKSLGMLNITPSYKQYFQTKIGYKNHTLTPLAKNTCWMMVKNRCNHQTIFYTCWTILF